MNTKIKLSISTLVVFITLFGLLAVATPASAMTCNSATIYSTVSTLNHPISAYFTYGTDYNQIVLGEGITTPPQTVAPNSFITQFLTDLTGNTTYYYRLVVQGVKTDTNNFTTPACAIITPTPIPTPTPAPTPPIYYQPINYQPVVQQINYQPPVNYQPVQQAYYQPPIQYQQPISTLTVVTTGSTQISDTTAQLNSLISDTSSSPKTAWFEWGTTIDLDNTTTSTSVDSLPSVIHADTLSGLEPGTTYYFRAVAENAYQTSKGAILSFSTTGTRPIGYVSHKTHICCQYQPTDIYEPQTGVPLNINTPPLEASAFLASLLPGSLLGWLFLIVLILILVFLVKYLLREYSGNKNFSKKTITTTTIEQ